MPAAGPDQESVEQWTAAVRALHAAQQAILAQVADTGVPAPWLAVLQLLEAAPDGRLPMTQIARDVAMSSGGFTKMADRMAQDGLIDRRGIAGDRRVVHAVLTDRGRALAAQTGRVYSEAVRGSVLDAISPAQLRALVQIGERLSAIGNLRGATTPTDDQFALHPRSPGSHERRDSAIAFRGEPAHQLH